jgi:hypothetical protein
MAGVLRREGGRKGEERMWWSGVDERGEVGGRAKSRAGFYIQ